jgi:hypothetical protein
MERFELTDVLTLGYSVVTAMSQVNRENKMTFQMIAKQAAKATKASDHGVVVYVQDCNGIQDFVIWGIKNNLLVSTKLDPANTSLERLTAHVQGFINNL